jgi:uncharacterized protein (DUF1501 family)
MNWSRRAFLKGGAVALFGAGVTGAGPVFLGRAALAASPRPALARRRVLVAIFQRGAMDGLAAVAPLDEQGWLTRLRPRLALGAGHGAQGARLLDLGVGYGLHPALEPLLPFFRDGDLAVVHGVGSPDPTRSHFDAQEFMESGTPGVRSTSDGWLNRVCGELGHEATPYRAVALGATMPRSLYGPEPTLAVADLAELRLMASDRSVPREVRGGLESLYRRASTDSLRGAAEGTFEAVALLEAVERGPQPRPPVPYPASPLGHSLRQIARLVRAGVGLEVAFAESGGWDTHVVQGGDGGSFARRASDLAASLRAFWLDLGEHRDDVVVLTMTEFGRTVAENGSGGTDHGHASCLFVLGGGVDGGRVHGGVESLDPDALHEGRDLPVTVDFRAVFAEVAGKHLGIDDDQTLFPGWTGVRLPLLRG